MISAILGLLGSNVFGSLIGWVGGYLNRKADFAVKQLELEHELKLRDKDLELMKAEVEGNFKVAQEESLGKIESSAYQTMAASYEGQFAPSGVWWVDALTRAVRPAVTIIFMLASLGVSFWMLSSAFNAGIQFSSAELKDWVTYTLQWVFFQSGVVIGWWFANRPSQKRAE